MTELIGLQQVYWTMQTIVWACLVFFGLRLKLISAYPIIYCYVFFSIVSETAMLFLSERLGLRSLTYSYIYCVVSMVALLLAYAILLRIYSALGAMRFRNDWHLALMPFPIILLVFADSREVWIFFRILDVGYAVLTYLGLATVIRMILRRRTVALGWNLRMALLALTIPACLYSLFIVAFTFERSISHQSVTFWTKATSLASWTIFAVGMSEHSPPRILDKGRRVEDESGAEADERAAASRALDDRLV